MSTRCFGATTLLGIASMLLAQTVAAENAATLYRYYDEAGVLVINDSIPPEYANKGYEVISPAGKVLQQVEPAKKDGPTAPSEQEVDTQLREDQFILRSYSSLDDIAHARDRKLELMAREIEMMADHLREYAKRRKAEQQRAANYQRSGQEVPPSVLKALEDLDALEKQTQELLATRKEERAETEARFKRYRARFSQLKGLANENDNEAAISAAPLPPQPEQRVGEKSRLSKSAIDPTIPPAEND